MYFIFSRSGSFRPEYSRLGEIRALLPPGAPVLAATATATKAIRDDVCRKLEMAVCKVVFVSPDRENIYFEVFTRTDIHEDMSPLLEELRANKILLGSLFIVDHLIYVHSSTFSCPIWVLRVITHPVLLKLVIIDWYVSRTNTAT